MRLCRSITVPTVAKPFQQSQVYAVTTLCLLPQPSFAAAGRGQEGCCFLRPSAAKQEDRVGCQQSRPGVQRRQVGLGGGGGIEWPLPLRWLIPSELSPAQQLPTGPPPPSLGSSTLACFASRRLGLHPIRVPLIKFINNLITKNLTIFNIKSI